MNRDRCPAKRGLFLKTSTDTYNQCLWGKVSRGDNSWHPLILHLLDVAVCADAILAREPKKTKDRFGEILGMEWGEARSWVLLLIACHDLGKANPCFQSRREGSKSLLASVSLQIPPGSDSRVNHAFVSQRVLEEILCKKKWPEDLACLAADAVGCHHGERAKPTVLRNLNFRTLGDHHWTNARQAIFNDLLDVFNPTIIPTKKSLTGPDFMLLAGLTSFSDWIGSNEDYFVFGAPEDCRDLPAWRDQRRTKAEQSLDAIGWGPRKALLKKEENFKTVFPSFSPRPLQEAVVNAVKEPASPQILLIEAPMGEGKTEAAFFAHLEIQRRFDRRGLYVALPTKATGNAMFKRALTFLNSFADKRRLDLQLAHGAAQLNDTFQNLRFSSIDNPANKGGVGVAEWFTNKKRALLSEYGVGTVDQALIPILPVRHHFVRLWGLANRVVVFDEIHAYDAYTGTLLLHLIRWLLALDSTVILLSATLPPSVRRELAKMTNTSLPQPEPAYPRLSVFQNNHLTQIHFEPDPKRRLKANVKGLSANLEEVKYALGTYLQNGGMGLALLNTVQRAQDLFLLFGPGKPLERGGSRVGKELPDGTQVFLFHARFPAQHRQQREDAALEHFGKPGTRNGRKILIATQVAEQSLDLDFDLVVTDLAPIDLVLQRAGRLWRHERKQRPLSEPTLLIAGLAGDTPPSFHQPLWWGKIYQTKLLLFTWYLLRDKKCLALPDEIDSLVEMVYEERAPIPPGQNDRVDKAISEEGHVLALQDQAHQSVIGRPDDGSWNDPARFVLCDEDAPEVHRTLMAQTRLGNESVMVVPLLPEDKYQPDQVLEFHLAKKWFLRTISISRNSVVSGIKSGGVPQGWKQSPLLRNCYPLLLDDRGRWVTDGAICLDEELGLVYEPKGSV